MRLEVAYTRCIAQLLSRVLLRVAWLCGDTYSLASSRCLAVVGCVPVLLDMQVLVLSSVVDVCCATQCDGMPTESRKPM